MSPSNGAHSSGKMPGPSGERNKSNFTTKPASTAAAPLVPSVAENQHEPHDAPISRDEAIEIVREQLELILPPSPRKTVAEQVDERLDQQHVKVQNGIAKILTANMDKTREGLSKKVTDDTDRILTEKLADLRQDLMVSLKTTGEKHIAELNKKLDKKLDEKLDEKLDKKLDDKIADFVKNNPDVIRPTMLSVTEPGSDSEPHSEVGEASVAETSAQEVTAASSIGGNESSTANGVSDTETSNPIKTSEKVSKRPDQQVDGHEGGREAKRVRLSDVSKAEKEKLHESASVAARKKLMEEVLDAYSKADDLNKVRCKPLKEGPARSSSPSRSANRQADTAWRGPDVQDRRLVAVVACHGEHFTNGVTPPLPDGDGGAYAVVWKVLGVCPVRGPRPFSPETGQRVFAIPGVFTKDQPWLTALIEAMAQGIAMIEVERKAGSHTRRVWDLHDDIEDELKIFLSSNNTIEGFEKFKTYKEMPTANVEDIIRRGPRHDRYGKTVDGALSEPLRRTLGKLATVAVHKRIRVEIGWCARDAMEGVQKAHEAILLGRMAGLRVGRNLGLEGFVEADPSTTLSGLACQEIREVAHSVHRAQRRDADSSDGHD